MKFLLLVLLNLCLFTQNVEANTNVHITIHSSTVANLYYQIYRNNRPIDEELNFVLVSDTGNKYLIKSNDSILLLQNIPFGNYTLTLVDHPFSYSISIDKEYLKTQHILKKIEVNNTISTPNTSDFFQNDLILLLFSVFVLLLLLLLIKES